jgi:hypothetical protein
MGYPVPPLWEQKSRWLSQPCPSVFQTQLYMAHALLRWPTTLCRSNEAFGCEKNAARALILAKNAAIPRDRSRSPVNAARTRFAPRDSGRHSRERVRRASIACSTVYDSRAPVRRDAVFARVECADVNQPQTDAKRCIVASLAARDHGYCGAPPELAKSIVAPETTAAVGRPSGNALRDPRALQTYQGGPRGASGW